MKMGYAYWGFLADKKFDKNGKIVTSPDGNAFYSWCIINSFQSKGYKVFQMMPNRDKIIEKKVGKDGVYIYFNDMGFENKTNPRYNSYLNMKKDMYDGISDWRNVTEDLLFEIWDANKVYELDLILLEWRMEIPGRNTEDYRTNENWQPDLFIQKCIIDYCRKHQNIKLVIFDLDYKLTEDDLYKYNIISETNYTIIELGYKWLKRNGINGYHVEIPFDFYYINNYKITYDCLDAENLVYVGNRYERDWCIDKYIPTELKGVAIYGNWLDGGRDSKERWPSIDFRPRINVEDMRYVYNNSVCTILFAKDEYLEHGFMTARIIESIFYGTLPLFIKEYGIHIIKKYAGEYARDLVVSDKSDVIEKVMYYKHNPELRKAVINYLRSHLKFMDSNKFVSDLEGILKI